MRVLVLRPQPDAERTAKVLRERGQEPVLAPLFSIVPGAEPAPKGPFDAIVLTSANAVPALEQLPKAWRKALPAFCVGSRTADAAGELGFATRNAKGNRADLLALISSQLPAPKKLLFVAGQDRHDDLPEQLRAAGHEVAIWTAYEARAVESLPEAAVEALRRREVDAALHYSPRSAQTFLSLAGAAGLTEQALALPQVALSAEIAAPLIGAGAGTVLVAEHAEEAALLAALDQLPARILLDGGAREETAAAEPAAETEKDAMSEPSSEQSPAAKRRSRSGRTPPTIELQPQGEPTAEVSPEAATPEPESAASPAAETERAAEAVLPSEALPREFEPPPPPLPERRPGLPALALAGLIGGAVGAGLVLLGLKLAGPDDAARLAELNRRIEALQAQSAALPSRAALEAIERKASAAADSAAKADAVAQSNASRLAELAKAAPAVAAGDAAALAQVTEKLSQADSNAAAARTAATELERRLGETGQRLAAVETTAKNALVPSRQALAATRIVLAERVRDAIAVGRPFQQDVAALAAGGIPAAELTALDTVAAKGASTGDALLAQFRSHRALFARESAPPASSWEDKLLGLASRIVTIRPVGDTGANDPATLPIRLENALVQNDIATAAALWAQLPEPARRPSEAFGTALKQRAAAEAAIAAIARNAVAALGSAG
ncbi:MAG: uroporphyrinogen-III synthase [Bosea sp.]|uniref:uroporphyrinogen-III synthase n=1 Tax=Bosea sp. (in: a-proteobacteria) TaxID=1871050 RepID=UPI001AD571D3|nr:uroporphyrinogen-III synthase [Bosea sp. (in: a-proteobacteria)]MBN9468351.1 uroporphyrinogen-III synthase [Bosea sp. (in: a-proteobacteria)]